MTDAAYGNAEARERDLLAEIEKTKTNLKLMENELSSVQNFMREWRIFAGLEERKPAEDSGGEKMWTNAAKPKRNSKKEEVAEEARRIIKERGEPVGRSDLYHELINRGYVINGGDPEMVLSTMLWRMRERITRLPGGGYWPTDVDAPQFGWSLSTNKMVAEELGDLM